MCTDHCWELMLTVSRCRCLPRRAGFALALSHAAPQQACADTLCAECRLQTEADGLSHV